MKKIEGHVVRDEDRHKEIFNLKVEFDKGLG